MYCTAVMHFSYLSVLRCLHITPSHWKAALHRCLLNKDQEYDGIAGESPTLSTTALFRPASICDIQIECARRLDDDAPLTFGCRCRDRPTAACQNMQPSLP